MKAPETRFKFAKVCWVYFGLTIFTFVLPYRSSGQGTYDERTRSWHLSAGISFNFCSVTDKKISALTYRGSSPGATVALNYQGKHAEHEITALYIANNNAGTNTSPKATLNTSIFNMEYANIYNLYASYNNLFSCKAGAGVQFLNTKRKFDKFINNDFSFETALSFGPVAELQYSPGENNSVTLTNRTTLPAFFIFSQPSYSGNTPEDQEAESGTAVKKLFTSTKTGSFSEFFRIKNQFAVNKHLGNNHAVSLFYNWEYYTIKTARNVITANNQAGIQYSYKF